MCSPKTQSGLTHTCSFFYLQSERGVIWGSVRAMKKQLGLGQEEGVKKIKEGVSHPGPRGWWRLSVCTRGGGGGHLIVCTRGGRGGHLSVCTWGGSGGV